LALQEVRNASPKYSDEESAVIAAEKNSYSVKEKAINALESGDLIRVGRRSKRLGFLAHGSGGDSPVRWSSSPSRIWGFIVSGQKKKQ
jgi:hypothetical protein